MSRQVCARCYAVYRVEGHPDGLPYVCPVCRGAIPDPDAPVTDPAAWLPPEDLPAQLAAVTAERDQLAARLAIGFATHPTPTLSPESAVAMPRRTPSPVESRLEPLTDEDRHQIAAQLLELRAERDKAITDRNHLADGLAHALGMDPGHPLPCSMLASVRIIVAAADAVREERDRLAADLDAVRRAAWVLLAVDGGDGHYHAIRLYDARVALRSLVGKPPPTTDPDED